MKYTPYPAAEYESGDFKRWLKANKQLQGTTANGELALGLDLEKLGRRG